MSNTASYDKALLDDAPEVSREQRQRFYDADLLYDDPAQNGSSERQRTTSNPNAAALPAGAAPARSRSVVHPRPNNERDGATTASPGRNKEYSPLPPPAVSSKSSGRKWYKTRAGIIALIVIALVVVAAVVGGAVGGTQANKNKKSSSSSSSSAAPAPGITTLPASITTTHANGSTSTTQMAGQAGSTSAGIPGASSSSAGAGVVSNPASTASSAPSGAPVQTN